METTPGDDDVKTVKETRKDLEQYINLVDRAAAAAAGFEKT